MPEHPFIARWSLIGGGVLVVISILLWALLPIPSMAPPYLFTAVLALGYGAFCWQQKRADSVGKS